MAYGINAEGLNGVYNVKSNTTSTEYLVPTITSGIIDIDSNPGTSDVLNKDAQDLVFAKPRYSDGTQTSYVLYRYDGTSITFFQNDVSYIVLKRTAALTASTTNVLGGDYGVQVKNTNGVIIYDSRKTTSGLKITGIHERASLGGGYQFNDGSGSGTSYQLTGNGYASQSGSRTNILQSGNIGNTYVSLGGGFSSGLGATNNNININQFYYDFGNNRILFIGTIRFFIQFGGSITVDRENTGEILRGELIS